MVLAWFQRRIWFTCKLALLCLLTIALSGFGGIAQPTPPDLEPRTVGQVTNLTATVDVKSQGTVRLTWIAAANAQVHFVVYIKVADVAVGNYGAARMAPFSGEEGVIEGLEVGTSYALTAIGMRWNWINFGTVWGDWSEWVFATPASQGVAQPTEPLPTTEPTTVGPVTDVTVSNTGPPREVGNVTLRDRLPPGEIRLAWSPAQNAQVHFVAYIESEDRAATNLGTAKIRPFVGSEGTISGLDIGKSYDFIVIGMRWNWINFGTVWGSWSPWVSAIIL